MHNPLRVRTLFLPRLSGPHDIFREIQEKSARRPEFEWMAGGCSSLGILFMVSQTYISPLHDLCRTNLSAVLISKWNLGLHVPILPADLRLPARLLGLPLLPLPLLYSGGSLREHEEEENCRE